MPAIFSITLEDFDVRIIIPERGKIDISISVWKFWVSRKKGYITPGGYGPPYGVTKRTRGVVQVGLKSPLALRSKVYTMLYLVSWPQVPARIAKRIVEMG